MRRIVALANGEFYHIISRSIAGYKVFNSDYEFFQFIKRLVFYKYNNHEMKFSAYDLLSNRKQRSYRENVFVTDGQLVEIIAFCLMPTHIHLLLRQIQDNGISQMMGNLLNSYSKYFNLKHKRRGPLWESKFKNVLIDSNEQLVHLTRYIHLNPVSAGLVEDPKEWGYSSYFEYIDNKRKDGICEFEKYIDLGGNEYKKFVLDRKDYQRKLSRIKKLLLESYTG